jgi:hypothetical protein
LTHMYKFLEHSLVTEHQLFLYSCSIKTFLELRQCSPETSTVAFWFIVRCNLVYAYHHFGAISSFLLQDNREMLKIISYIKIPQRILRNSVSEINSNITE